MKFKLPNAKANVKAEIQAISDMISTPTEITIIKSELGHARLINEEK